MKGINCKRLIVTAALLLLGPWGAMAQALDIDLDFSQPPFLGYRDTLGVKTERTYKVDPATKEKRLTHTCYYDRQGYLQSRYLEHTYDDQNRLITRRRLEKADRKDTSATPALETRGIVHIEYNERGLVQRCTDSLLFNRDDGQGKLVETDIYELIDSVVDPKYGLCELDYRHISFAPYQTKAGYYIDTSMVKMIRTLDRQGHLIKTEVDDPHSGRDFMNEMTYDAQGRMVEKKSLRWEYFDSVHYTYTATECIGSGKAYSEEFSADIWMRCTLGGIPIETLQKWNAFDDEPAEEQHQFYDEKGLLIREENTTLTTPPTKTITVIEREYWEGI